MAAPLYDYKGYALIIKKFLCKRHGYNERKMYTHSYCQMCPAWGGKTRGCCLDKISKALRGKPKNKKKENTMEEFLNSYIPYRRPTMGMGLVFGSTMQKSERKSVKELVEAEGGSIEPEEKLNAKDEYEERKPVISVLFGFGISNWNDNNPNNPLAFEEVEDILLQEYSDEGYSLLLDFFNGTTRSSTLLGMNEISIAENISNICQMALPLIYLADKIRDIKKLEDTLNWLMKGKEAENEQKV